ncbi:MAG: HAD family phosphatase [Ignavibacteriaceae bacterium]|nr:HAD family phosphatase [Ignavibacteriaceae bacterium]
MNRKYSAIVFDLGNVLIPFDYNILVDKFNEIKPGLGNKFVEYYRANYSIHRDFERGFVSEKEFISKMLEVIDNRIDADTFCNYYANIFSVNEEVASLLPMLKKNYKLFLLSNTDSIHQKYGWQKYEFLKHFDELILSHEVGAVKPEEKIYRAVEEASSYPSEEHIFVDDIEEYVNAAKSLGWSGIQFKDYSNLVDELKIRKLLNSVS